jgi:hypothetical protein
MSNLKDLVPPFELCKLIPKEEFEDTAFYHLVLIKSTDEYSEIISSKDKYLFKNDPNVKVYPAPTFVEIIDDMPVWEMQEELLYAFDRTERALKLWLKYKGIDYEE